ncbi:MAG: VTT domain-containing protein [Solirubrobacterales bacterium]|nr:VTT domain-containing protein [Solirubrobacterales bacterium]
MLLLHDASITDSLATLATKLINDLGLGGIFGLDAWSGVLFFPGTEVTHLFGGFSVSDHHLTLLGVILAGVLGDLFGATLAYALGYFGLYKLLERLPGPFNVSSHGLDKVNAWFDRWGLPTFFFARLLPAARAAPPYMGGIAKVPYWKFMGPTAAASVIWIGGLTLIGKAVGASWPKWKHNLEYVDYAVAVIIVVLVVWFLYARIWKPRAAARAQASVD